MTDLSPGTPASLEAEAKQRWGKSQLLLAPAVTRAGAPGSDDAGLSH